MKHWEHIGDHISIKSDEFDAHKIIEIRNNGDTVTLTDGCDSYYTITVDKIVAIEIFSELVSILCIDDTTVDSLQDIKDNQDMVMGLK